MDNIFNSRRNARLWRTCLPYLFLACLILLVLWPRGGNPKSSGSSNLEPTLEDRREFWMEQRELERKWKYPERDLDLNPDEYKKLPPVEEDDYDDEDEWEKEGKTATTSKLKITSSRKKPTIPSTKKPAVIPSGSDKKSKDFMDSSGKKPQKNETKLKKQDFVSSPKNVISEIKKKNLSLEVKQKAGTLTSKRNLTSLQIDLILKKDRKKFLNWDAKINAYRFNFKYIIWTFVPGKIVPPIIHAGIQTIRCHFGFKLHLEVITENSLSHWLPDLHPAFYFLKPHHKRDYVRARILDEYGGWYMDPSTIGLPVNYRSLDRFMGKLRGKQLFYYSPGTAIGAKIARVVAGPMRAQSKFTSKQINKIQVVLDSSLTKLEKYSKNPLKNRYPLDNVTTLGFLYSPRRRDPHPEFVAQPLNVQRTWGQLINKTDLLFRNSTPLFIRQTQFLMYEYDRIPQHVRNMSLTAVLRSSMLISKIIRFSYGKCMGKHYLNETDKDFFTTTPKPKTPLPLGYLTPVPVWRFPDIDYMGLSADEIARRERNIIRWALDFLTYRSKYKLALTLLKNPAKKINTPANKIAMKL